MAGPSYRAGIYFTNVSRRHDKQLRIIRALAASFASLSYACSPDEYGEAAPRERCAPRADYIRFDAAFIVFRMFILRIDIEGCSILTCRLFSRRRQ